jgi:fatty acid CoA ligase FadD22
MEVDEKERIAVRLRAVLANISNREDRISARIEGATTPEEVFRLIDSEFH